MSSTFPADFGPIYSETLQGRFPVEPWNTVSNLVFLLIALRYLYATKLNARNHPLLVYSLPVLFAGFIGGTVYHATRSHNFWLLMDFIPIALLALAAAATLWARVLRIRGLVSFVLLLGVLMLIRKVPAQFGFERSLAISLNYALLGLLILVPALLHSAQRAWSGVLFILAAAALFGTAVSCRILDAEPEVLAILPMGSHFLWHIFGGASVWCLMEYLYRHLPPASQQAQHQNYSISP